MLNGPTEMLWRVFGTWLTGSNPAISICSLLALVILQTATRTSPQFPLSGTSNSMVGSNMYMCANNSGMMASGLWGIHEWLPALRDQGGRRQPEWSIKTEAMS